MSLKDDINYYENFMKERILEEVHFRRAKYLSECLEDESSIKDKK